MFVPSTTEKPTVDGDVECLNHVSTANTRDVRPVEYGYYSEYQVIATLCRMI